MVRDEPTHAMPKDTARLLEKEVTLTSQGHYDEEGDLLVLKRWRINAEGKIGSWKMPDEASGNGGWPSFLTKDLQEPAKPVSKKRRK